MVENEIKPHQDLDESKRVQVEKMFDEISEKYDFMNRLMTFGMDKKWRKNVMRKVAKNDPDNILDIATGTGDMAILLSETHAESIVGIDISQGMLNIANQKIEKKNLTKRISTSIQDSENMSFEDNSFCASTAIYGIRNFEHLKVGLAEIRRVLKEGGTFVILETSVPKNAFIKWGYMLYTKHIMPFIARFFSKDKNAYEYLSTSAINFPYGEELKKILEEVGFKNVKIKPQFFGVSTIYVATK